MQFVKEKMGWIVAGVLIAAFAYHAYTVYSLKADLKAVVQVVQQDNTRINQIVEFINKATQAGAGQK